MGFCFKCGCRSRSSAFETTCYLLPLVALWDAGRRKCTSNPPCRLQEGVTLLRPREMGREASTSGVVQAVVRPTPPLLAHTQVVGNLGGVFHFPTNESRPATQHLGHNDFSWTDNFSAYISGICDRYLIPTSTRNHLPHPPVHPWNGHHSDLRVL